MSEPPAAGHDEGRATAAEVNFCSNYSRHTFTAEALDTYCTIKMLSMQLSTTYEISLTCSDITCYIKTQYNVFNMQCYLHNKFAVIVHFS